MSLSCGVNADAMNQMVDGPDYRDGQEPAMRDEWNLEWSVLALQYRLPMFQSRVCFPARVSSQRISRRSRSARSIEVSCASEGSVAVSMNDFPPLPPWLPPLPDALGTPASVSTGAAIARNGKRREKRRSIGTGRKARNARRRGRSRRGRTGTRGDPAMAFRGRSPELWTKTPSGSGES